jgi:hypothetical protein
LVAALLLSACGTCGAVADEASATSATSNSRFDQLLSEYDVAVSGYVDASYLALLASGDGGVRQLTYHELGADSNSVALDQASLTIARQPASGFGALVDLMSGRDVEYLPGRYANEFALEQAFGQFVAGAWTLQAGKFVTLAGTEDIAPTGDTNTSRSLLFFAEPLTHTGVRITDAMSNKITVIAGLNNGWTKCDRNSNSFACGSATMGELATIFTPTKELSISVQGYYGPQSFTPSSGDLQFVRANRALADAIATYIASSALTIIGNLDYGSQANFDGNNHTASYIGAALYLNIAFSESWRASLRGEYVNDRDSHFFVIAANPLSCTDVMGTARCGYKSNRVSEQTLTIAYDPAKSLELRLEGRVDASSNRVFESGSGTLGESQLTVSLEALYRFGS